MSRPEPDPSIDAQLRDVALPPGFFERLRAAANDCAGVREAEARAAAGRDAKIDQQLRAVVPPEGFNERLRDAVAGAVEDRNAVDDCRLDGAIRNVAFPPGCAARLRTIPHQRRRSAARTAALAACLMLMLGAAYGGALGGVLISLRPVVPSTGPLMVIDEGPVKIAASHVSEPRVEAFRQPPPFSENVSWVSLQSEPPELQFIDRPRPGAFGELWRQINSGMQPWDDALRLRWNILGAAHHDDERPAQLERAEPPTPRGIEPPLAPGFDRAFLHVHGAHPLIYPASDQSLRSHVAPLSLETGSFDRTERLAAEGRLPDADQVRIEDFLAAVGCGFPDSSAPVGIRTAAGPSAFGQPLTLSQRRLSPHLLQIGVKAGPLERGAEASHLTIALDVSASMQWAGRLEMTRRALDRLVDHLRPSDRLSLVAFNETTDTPFEAAGVENAEQMRDVFDRLRADGGTNLAAGVRQALSAAMSGKGDPAARNSLALITDSRDAVSADELQQLEEMMSHAAGAGLNVVVVDLNDGPAQSADWHSAALQSGHELRRAGDASEVLWTLVEMLAGRSAVVAADVELTVRFNPQSVAAYRLIGHEANALAAVSGGAVSIDLRCGQEASALFEVWLAANDEDDVATAEAAFVDSAAGEPVRQQQRISRLQFAPSQDGSPLSLQAAALAAETGEILRGSPFSPGDRQALLAVAEAAERVNPQLESRPEYRRFVSLLQRLCELHGGD